ncbi:hypothetical protein RCF27_09185 [Rhodococcus pyridinivorans]|uniref:hypothetical protein n=1 Tax=Rhodococcus pyridinivorans TaxID=103816 RepID=UPI00280B917D|nr:hypothetical protein [Rhodococcus pyridinivorans]WMM74431.1 hypothetical protein RCF27_09185 [Rhodococcus pyridinivorans]
MKRSILVLPIVLGLALAGCSNSSDDTTEAAQASATTASTASAPAEVKFEVGDTVTFGRDPIGSATLLSMEINPECEYPSYDPESTDARMGRTTHVALEMSVEAGQGGTFINIPSLSISERDKDGYTANTLAHSEDRADCYSYDDLLSTVSSGEKQRGWVLLAAEASEGEFVWNLQQGGKKVVIPFSTSNPNTSTAAAPTAAANIPGPRQVDYQDLADKLTEIGQESTPVTAADAKQMAGLMCGLIELDPVQDGATDRMIQQLAADEGIPEDIAADMINTMVEYECPGAGA